MTAVPSRLDYKRVHDKRPVTCPLCGADPNYWRDNGKSTSYGGKVTEDWLCEACHATWMVWP